MNLSATSPATPSAPSGHKRVTTRRGSTSASDPFGKNNQINMDPNRSTSSTLTIVRVVSQPVQPPTPALQDPPAQRRFPSHRRIGSNPQQPTPHQNQADAPARVGFGFSSFGSGPALPPSSSSSNRDNPPSSPTSSPRLRPTSPHRLSSSNTSLNKPRYTPDQLVELARQSINPNHIHQQQQVQASLSSPNSPVTHARPYSPGGYRPSSPLSPAPQSASTTAPATFTPLPEDIYLPFIDRPTEVAALISSPPSSKLFQLLAQTFSEVGSVHAASDLPDDPTTWSYMDLHTWLTQVDRPVVSDALWVLKARKCVLSHSELIWERIKGAFGIPPELDVDMDLEAILANNSSSSSVNTDDIPEDGGRKARGHWDDWDAIMDSPVFDRNSPVFTRRTLHDSEDALAPAGQTGETTLSPTPDVHGSPQTTTQEVVDDDQSHTYVSSLTSLSIEPLLIPSATSSGPIGGQEAGLGDIAEGAEEEEEEELVDENQVERVDLSASATSQDDSDSGLVHPSQIQGLKISTTLLPVSGLAAAVSVGSGPVSPSSSYPSPLVGPVFAHSRSPSVGSMGSLGSGFLRRSDSFGSVLAVAPSGIGLMGPAAARVSGSAISADVWEDTFYDPVGDRSPGNPLFPSNFARLSTGPTLVANNSALRYPGHPPASRYTDTYHEGPSAPGSVASGTSSQPRLPPRFGLGKTRTYSHGASVGYVGVGKDAGSDDGSGKAKKFRRGSEGAVGTSRLREFAMTAASRGGGGTGPAK